MKKILSIALLSAPSLFAMLSGQLTVDNTLAKSQEIRESDLLRQNIEKIEYKNEEQNQNLERSEENKEIYRDINYNKGYNREEGSQTYSFEPVKKKYNPAGSETHGFNDKHREEENYNPQGVRYGQLYEPENTQISQERNKKESSDLKDYLERHYYENIEKYLAIELRALSNYLKDNELLNSSISRFYDDVLEEEERRYKKKKEGIIKKFEDKISEATRKNNKIGDPNELTRQLERERDETLDREDEAFGELKKEIKRCEENDLHFINQFMKSIESNLGRCEKLKDCFSLKKNLIAMIDNPKNSQAIKQLLMPIMEEREEKSKSNLKQDLFEYTTKNIDLVQNQLNNNRDQLRNNMHALEQFKKNDYLDNIDVGDAEHEIELVRGERDQLSKKIRELKTQLYQFKSFFETNEEKTFLLKKESKYKISDLLRNKQIQVIEKQHQEAEEKYRRDMLDLEMTFLDHQSEPSNIEENQEYSNFDKMHEGTSKFHA